MTTGMKRKETGAANELLGRVLDAPAVQGKRESFSDGARASVDQARDQSLSGAEFDGDLD